FGDWYLPPLANVIRQQPDQVLVIDVLFAVCQRDESIVDVLQLVSIDRESELFETMTQGGPARVLAEHQMGPRDSHQSGSHDLVAKRIGKHAVLVNARFMRESIGADDCLVGRRLERDDL